VTTRAVTDESLAESIRDLAGVPLDDEQDVPYRGRPLAASPVFAPPTFFVGWPVVVAGLWLLASRRHR